MLYIKTYSTDAAFYFAAEEYCMNNMEDDVIIMFWQTDNCIMLGNNQIAASEINLEKATTHNIEIVRRPSGGGTIYTDNGTLLISVITPFHANLDVKVLQRELIEEPLTFTLNKLGIAAEIKGRNDVLIDGKKISGIAQHLHNHKLCSHCSLLFDADFSILDEVLNPDIEKMQLKGIKSVKSRVTNLKEYIQAEHISSSNVEGNIKLSEFKKEFIPLFLENFNSIKQMEFNESDLSFINQIIKDKYNNPEWNFGKNIVFDDKYNYQYSCRFTQGKVELFLKIDKGYIQYCKIKGDFLNIKPITYIEQKLQCIRYTPASVKKALELPNIGWYLGGIDINDFLHCFFAK